MGEILILRFPDGRVVEGSVEEILTMLSSIKDSIPVISGELVEEFMIWLKAHGISARTIRDYSRSLGKIIGTRIDEVNPTGTQVWLEILRH